MRSFVRAQDPDRPPRGLESAVYAIGNFDGVHVGHQAVIRRTLAIARARSAPAAILTFEPHPADYFAGQNVVFRLTSLDDKIRVFKKLGLDGAVALSFNAELASLSAEDFVSGVILDRLGVSGVVVGWDFHFGRGRSGNPDFLADAGARRGFAVDIVPKVQQGEGGGAEVVSSTAIRRALEKGDLAAATRGLGRFYSVHGIVSEGQRLGRKLGVPTANIALEPTNRLAYGVYAVLAHVGERTLPAVASFGVRPAVDNGPPLLEVHILDFSEDLYGQELGVDFVERIREERNFDSLAALTAEMERDKLRAREILARLP
jgi:riboflavin kinase/FMN adenylyltransferase